MATTTPEPTTPQPATPQPATPQPATPQPTTPEPEQPTQCRAPRHPMHIRLDKYRGESLKTGRYLAAPSEEFVWYTLPATNASYLIHASDAPSSSEEADPAHRPPPAELVMIIKVSEDNWYFRSEANWQNREKQPPYEKTKLTFIGAAPAYGPLIDDFKKANANLTAHMDEIADKNLETEGGFTDEGIRVRHGIFGRRDEVPQEVVDKAYFNIAEWPVNTSAARRALADIAESHYIIAPRIYDYPGQMVRPLDYARRFRGATGIVTFIFTHYKWPEKNTFCADLGQLRVLVTPSPRTPVTPLYGKRYVLEYDPLFTITQPDFKKAKIYEDEED